MADPTAISKDILCTDFGRVQEADQVRATRRAGRKPSSQSGLAGSDFARLVEALRELLISVLASVFLLGP